MKLALILMMVILIQSINAAPIFGHWKVEIFGATISHDHPGERAHDLTPYATLGTSSIIKHYKNKRKRKLVKELEQTDREIKEDLKKIDNCVGDSYKCRTLRRYSTIALDAMKADVDNDDYSICIDAVIKYTAKHFETVAEGLDSCQIATPSGFRYSAKLALYYLRTSAGNSLAMYEVEDEDEDEEEGHVSKIISDVKWDISWFFKKSNLEYYTDSDIKNAFNTCNVYADPQ